MNFNEAASKFQNMPLPFESNWHICLPFPLFESGGRSHLEVTVPFNMVSHIHSERNPLKQEEELHREEFIGLALQQIFMEFLMYGCSRCCRETGTKW